MHQSSLAIPFLFLVACGGVPTGYVVVNGENNPLYEIEPNGFAGNADYLGEIKVGSSIAIEGHIAQCCNSSSSCCPDEYDGFAFYALEPVSVHIRLTEYSPTADLDFAIFIPEINGIVDSWETDSHPETGVFNMGGSGEFHIVLNSFLGDSNYLLEVDVAPLAAANLASDDPHPEKSANSRLTRERFSAYAGQALPVSTREVRIIELADSDQDD
ncbi:MAG: hypothetical protein ACI8X5_003934 [Planctomycetota bacterium]|jgi:hypothetical protein